MRNEREQPAEEPQSHSDVVADLEVSMPATDQAKKDLLANIDAMLRDLGKASAGDWRDPVTGRTVAITRYPDQDSGVVAIVAINDAGAGEAKPTKLDSYTFTATADGIQVEMQYRIISSLIIESNTTFDETHDIAHTNHDEMLRGEEAAQDERELGITQFNVRDAKELEAMLNRCVPIN